MDRAEGVPCGVVGGVGEKVGEEYHDHHLDAGQWDKETGKAMHCDH